MAVNVEWNQIYCGPAPHPAVLWERWNLDPVVLLALLLMAYLLRRSRRGAAAVVVLAVAFVSPLCALSSALFSARVVHHLLLIAVAAPLLADLIRLPSRGQAGLALAVSTTVLWGWHVPQAYDLALSNIGIYWLMQLSLIASFVWFWQTVFAPDRTPVEAIALVVAGFTQMGMLGALLTFASSQLYEAHAFAPLEWGMLPLTDQQLGGLIMWVPAGIPYAIIVAVLARRFWGAGRVSAT